MNQFYTFFVVQAINPKRLSFFTCLIMYLTRSVAYWIKSRHNAISIDNSFAVPNHLCFGNKEIQLLQNQSKHLAAFHIQDSCHQCQFCGNYLDLQLWITDLNDWYRFIWTTIIDYIVNSKYEKSQNCIYCKNNCENLFQIDVIRNFIFIDNGYQK